MSDDFDETSEPVLTTDEEALLKEVPTLTDVGQARRKFIGQSIAGGLGIFALTLLEQEKVLASLATSPDAPEAASPNGLTQTLRAIAGRERRIWNSNEGRGHLYRRRHRRPAGTPSMAPRRSRRWPRISGNTDPSHEARMKVR